MDSCVYRIDYRWKVVPVFAFPAALIVTYLFYSLASGNPPGIQYDFVYLGFSGAFLSIAVASVLGHRVEFCEDRVRILGWRGKTREIPYSDITLWWEEMKVGRYRGNPVRIANLFVRGEEPKAFLEVRNHNIPQLNTTLFSWLPTKVTILNPTNAL